MAAAEKANEQPVDDVGVADDGPCDLGAKGRAIAPECFCIDLGIVWHGDQVMSYRL